MTVLLLNVILPTIEPAAVLHLLIAVVKVIVFLLAVGVALGISLILIRLIWRIRWLSQKQKNTIRLANQGNVASGYRIAAVSPDRKFNFVYSLDGANLPLLKAAPLPPLQAAPVASELAANEEPLPQSQPPSAQAPDSSKTPDAKKMSGAKEALSKSAGKADAGIKQVGGITGILIDILATAGSLIPGSLGTTLKQRADSLRSQKNSLNSTLEQPALKAQQVKHLQNQVGALGTAAGVPGKEAGAAIPHTTPLTTASSKPVPTHAGGNGHNPQTLPASAGYFNGLFSTYVQLPPLAPAGNLELELSIEPLRKYSGGSYVYWLYTEPIEQPNLPTEEPLLPIKTVQKISVKAIPPGYWVLSILLSALIVVFNGIWLVYLYVWLARILA